MAAGPTAGLYANRDGEYEVLPDGTVWLIGGSVLPEGSERVLLAALPPDAAMTEGAWADPLRVAPRPRAVDLTARRSIAIGMSKDSRRIGLLPGACHPCCPDCGRYEMSLEANKDKYISHRA